MTSRSTSFSVAIMAISNAVAQIGNTVGRVLADKKITGTEYLDLLLASPHLQTIFVNAPAANADYLILSDEERAEVHAALSAKLDIPQDEVEAKIETTLKEAGNIYVAFTKLLKSAKIVIATWKPVKVSATVTDGTGKKVKPQPAE